MPDTRSLKLDDGLRGFPCLGFATKQMFHGFFRIVPVKPGFREISRRMLVMREMVQYFVDAAGKLRAVGRNHANFSYGY